MTRDRRFWRATARVAHESLAGHVDLPLTAGTLRSVAVPVAELVRFADGMPRRDKQLLFGQSFCVLETQDDWAVGVDPVDGYVGHLREADLGEGQAASHRITALSSHIYSEPDLKSPERASLSYGARLALTGEASGEWRALAYGGGWVTEKHVADVADPAPDWVAEAERFLGVPYLWGGNSSFGIDCSGLVQIAMQAAGRDCPRDSDLQEAAFAEAAEPYQRGDLVFRKGHVGILLDGETLLHANAHHMAVAREPLSEAIERIGQKEFGAVTKVARPR